MFRWWKLKLRNSGGSSSSLDPDEVIEIDESGDEGQDLSIILDVKVKTESADTPPLPEIDEPTKVADDPYSDLDPRVVAAEEVSVLESLEALGLALEAEAEEEFQCNGDGYGDEGSDLVEPKPKDDDDLSTKIPSETTPPMDDGTASKSPTVGHAADLKTVTDVEAQIKRLEPFGFPSIMQHFCFLYLVTMVTPR